jgi:hypothetical protein
MGMAKRAMLTLVTLGLGVAAWSGSSRPGDVGQCGVAAAAPSGGCCHYNKGVCNCEGGRVRCCDGKVSASCGCTDGPPMRQPIETRTPLALADVAFASQEIPEPPSPRLTWFRLGVDAVRFWFRLDCGDDCWSRLAANGLLPLEVRWFFDPGSGPMPDGIPQTIVLPRNRPSIFVTRPINQLRLGHWETEVRFDTERLCMRGGDRCWFSVEVRP